MLYERWRQVARNFSNAVALRDLASGRLWTFAELAATAERGGVEPSGNVSFPHGVSPEFIFEVLRAWKAGKIVCPLESNQTIPQIGGALPEGVVHLKSTSATTGAARMIAFTAEQLAADADNIVATMKLRSDWPNIGVISLAHSYGFSNLALPLLLHGIPLILVDAPLPERLRRAASFYESVTLPAVPALWRTWHDADAIPANVRLAISAGAPLPVALEQNVYAVRGLKIHNFYGSSECGGIAYDSSSSPRTDGAFVGKPMRNVKLSVAEDGCLEVQSKAVGLTYWPETNPALSNSVFRASDLVEIVNDSVYLRGRVSDQINVAGRKISPEAIEKVLSTHPSVCECLVFGVPVEHGDRSEIIVACVVGKAGPNEDVLRQFLLEKLPAWQVPREWWFVESLAANARGKLSRAEWRKRFNDLASAGENIP